MITTNNSEGVQKNRTTGTVIGQKLNGATVALPSYSMFSETEVPCYFEKKKLLIRGFGLLLLLLFLPVILLIMIVVRLGSPGSAIYRQRRMGLGCRAFTLYKIRTMCQDAENTSGPVWCQQSDSRITGVGRLLRILHLDELPQLINVVRGEMDLVGPRPERPEFIDGLVEKVPGYAERMNVLPGVTGLSQINLPPDETVECVRRKLELDMNYIQTASWGLDFRILLCTALRMIGVRHGVAVKLLKLNRSVSQLENTHRNSSSPDVVKPNSSIPVNLQPAKSLKAVIGNGNQVGSNGSSLNGSSGHLNRDTHPENLHVSANGIVDANKSTALPIKPK